VDEETTRDQATAAEGQTSQGSGSGRMRRLFFHTAPLVAAGVIGAGVALGVGYAIDGGGETTTVAVPVAATSNSTVASATSEGTTSQTATAPSKSGTFEAGGASLSVAEIYERSGPGVVRVTSVGQAAGADSQDPFAPSQPQDVPLGEGSGFVIDKAGHILTNYHVVQNANEVQITFSGGDSVRATVVGVDPSTDLAVLEVDLPASALTPLPLGDSDNVQVGDEVVAIGNPFGLDRTVTKGIVSALQRQITAPNGFTIDEAIQTDAAINHGNSGGPLINTQGEVIGVNSQIETGGVSEGNVGVGFAVPVNTVKDVAAQLIDTGKVERAFLGIEMEPITPDLAQAIHVPVDKGVLIAAVRAGSPADAAGLKGGDSQVIVNGEAYSIGGDVITAVNGTSITDPDQLRELILAMKPGDKVQLEVNRDGSTLTITVELGRQPATQAG
jgi:S1-C subfamily serine protease